MRTESAFPRPSCKVLELVRWATDYLTGRGIENARLDVERMLASTLGTDRVGLYLQFDRPLTAEELSDFRSLLERRAQREPLAYILGEWEFFGLPLRVDRRALIPRPETERLVEVCLSRVDRHMAIRFVDLGTGCGNIAAALAANCPEAVGWAFDISKEAARLARENLHLLGVGERICVAVADMRKCPLRIAGEESGLDLVISNPPYVRPEDWPTLQQEIVRYEPRDALVAEPDGLAYYRAIARVAKHTLRRGGMVAVEIGADQAGEVTRILQDQGLTCVEVHKDLAGRDRVVTARRGEQG